MENKLVTFKAKPHDVERWQAAVKQEGKTLSHVIRAALESFAKRVEKKAGALTKGPVHD